MSWEKDDIDQVQPYKWHGKEEIWIKVKVKIYYDEGCRDEAVSRAEDLVGTRGAIAGPKYLIEGTGMSIGMESEKQIEGLSGE